MEKNNNVNVGEVVDEVIEHVEKGEKLKERAIKKIKQDKDMKKYVSDLFLLIICFVVFLIVLEVPDVLSYFYVDNINPFEVICEVLYLVILFFILGHNYITLRKLKSK